jgi:hypothetical protein
MASRILARTAVAGVLLAALCLPAAASLSGPRQDSADQSSATEPDALGAADFTVRRRSGPAAGTSNAKSGTSAKPSEKPSVKPRAKPSAKPARATRYPGYYGPVGGPSRRPKPVFLGVGGSW